jgi:hypothetical protein
MVSNRQLPLDEALPWLQRTPEQVLASQPTEDLLRLLRFCSASPHIRDDDAWELCSVRHENRHGHVPENVARRTAEHELAQP